jgi:hypothetical protein
MITDALLKFSDAQAVTAAAASTSHIDLGVARDIGNGQQLYVAISVDVALTDGSSDSTLTVDLQFDSTTTFTPDASQTLCVIPALSAIGYKRIIPIAPLVTPYRYMQLYYTPNNGNLTTGSISASIVLASELQSYYASGYTLY